MKLAVYIPCYNAERTLEEALGAILEQTRSPDEILVIDDGSTDGTAQVAGHFADCGVRLLSQPCNRGLGATRNRALAESCGDILIGLDADVAAEPDYLACVEEAFRAHPNVGAICGQLIESRMETLADQWRAAHMCQHHGPESLENPPLLYGCTTAIRRSVAQRIGGWSERFRAAYEDVDLSVRLRQAGIATRYEAGCRAYHLRTDTVPTVLDAFWRWHAPLGEIAGHFDSVKNWIEQMAVELPWQVFRERFSQDLQAGRNELLPLTMLLPWWMTACDLEKLAQRFGSVDHTIAEIAQRLPVTARSTLVARGAVKEFADWVAGQLTVRFRKVVTERFRSEASPAAAVAISRIRDAASRSLPADPATWAKIGSSFREWANVPDPLWVLNS